MATSGNRNSTDGGVWSSPYVARNLAKMIPESILPAPLEAST